jgi:hypothetical protein
MNLGLSDKRIYQQMQWGGDIDKLCKSDRISMLNTLEQFNFRWDIKTETMQRPRLGEFSSYDTPWCHARHLPGKRCGLDHQVTFNAFGIIPPRCMECWKTVVTPKSFDELLTWKKVQEEEMDLPAKCGIELRDYTAKHYGAYHYANSFEEGREQYEVVKELAKKYLSDETAEGVILKRACTEFEMIKGPSSNWFLTDEDEEMLNLIETFVTYPNVVKPQPVFHKPNIMIKWVLFAHSNNDMSYVKHNGGKVLFPGYMKYHEGDINGIKHDLAIGHSAARGVDAEVTEEFLIGTSKFARDNGLTLDKFGSALGYKFKSNSGILDFTEIKRVDPEVIGGADIVVNDE